MLRVKIKEFFLHQIEILREERKTIEDNASTTIRAITVI